MDTIFGVQNFMNEIIWKRTSAHSSAKRCGPVHDVVLFYSKSSEFTWNRQFEPYTQEYVDGFYHHREDDGRRFQVGDLTGAGTRKGEIRVVAACWMCNQSRAAKRDADRPIEELWWRSGRRPTFALREASVADHAGAGDSLGLLGPE